MSEWLKEHAWNTNPVTLHRVITKHLFAQSIQRLPARECFAM